MLSTHPFVLSSMAFPFTSPKRNCLEQFMVFQLVKKLLISVESGGLQCSTKQLKRQLSSDI
jgi:hypothetical protein